MAAELFDEVIVAAMRNPQKGETLFGMYEREAMLNESFAHLPNVRTTMFGELVVTLARRRERRLHREGPARGVRLRE